MAKKVSKEISVAKRILKFKTTDFRKNPLITNCYEKLISDKDWEGFAGNALLIMDGWYVLQYAEEYPIVHYRCDEASRGYLEGEPRLNSFIESITVSTALYGKKAWFGTGKLSCKNTDYDTVCYYTDNEGINRAIIQHEICCFLLEKPNIILSPEGVIVFFTEKQILATVDCNHYQWIDGYEINLEGRRIKDIEVCKDFCKVILIDDQKVEHNFSLKFNFDFVSHQLICAKASEL